MSTVTLGGDRLGGENKMKVENRHFERSNHDPSQTWLSTMSVGTIVPCYNELRLPGDDSEISVRASIQTNPTNGPLYGSFKFQVDFFQYTARFFNARITLDEAGLGMDIENVKLPMIELMADHPVEGEPMVTQINPSCILSYFDISGLGHANTTDETRRIYRRFQMLKLLGYWEIYKLYYANKQEKIGAVIHNNLQPNNYLIDEEEPPIAEFTQNNIGGQVITLELNEEPIAGNQWAVYPTSSLRIAFQAPLTGDFRINPETILIQWGDSQLKATQLFDNYEIFPDSLEIKFWNLNVNYQTPFLRTLGSYWILDTAENLLETEPQISTFELANIDKMRRQILRHPDDNTPFTITNAWAAGVGGLSPYKLLFPSILDEETGKSIYSIQSSQEGLGLKTYLSDVNQNWLDKEWIDGENGVNALTAVQVDAEGKITMDQINLAQKVYRMLNAVAIGDGSMRSWQIASYDHEGTRLITSPMYLGSLIKEISFQQVISNAATTEQPLGTLAGRGGFTDKHKGGHIKIKIDEVSYVTAVVSITPRIVYTQGNKWDNLIENFQQLHVPPLDQMGFQDLVTDTLAWWDTQINVETNAVTYKSAGKQPAWINYTTNVNKAYGGFREINNKMFMILGRNYEPIIEGTQVRIKDLTTYIDPSKYNYIFAYTKLDAQNFEVQIAFDEELRRKMSNRLIPQM